MSLPFSIVKVYLPLFPGYINFSGSVVPNIRHSSVITVSYSLITISLSIVSPLEILIARIAKIVVTIARAISITAALINAT